MFENINNPSVEIENLKFKAYYYIKCITFRNVCVYIYIIEFE